jgi:hypothetical protein
MFTVLVTWTGAKRAERLDAAGGCTTLRRIHATMFPDRATAERAARACLDGIPNVQGWRVAPF